MTSQEVFESAVAARVDSLDDDGVVDPFDALEVFGVLCDAASIRAVVVFTRWRSA